jgi:hypothetical protein
VITCTLNYKQLYTDLTSIINVEVGPTPNQECIIINPKVKLWKYCKSPNFLIGLKEHHKREITQLLNLKNARELDPPISDFYLFLHTDVKIHLFDA